MYPRFLKDSLLRSFQVSPVTLLIGPRQSGKTTLMQEIGRALQMDYLTFDTLKHLAAAQEDPEGCIGGLSRPVIIDEIQRVPQIALPIKLRVDQNRMPGLFGLTGSANPLVAPKLNDSLAGRMFILHMWPLSMGEIQKKRSQFLERAFDPSAAFPQGTAWSRKEMIDTFSAGGYPDALALQGAAREQWYDNLLTTILERDVQDITNISRPQDIAKLLGILAERSSNLLNVSELSRLASIPYTTLTQYMALLESLFLIIRQPAWHRHRMKRLIKMPKLYFGDTGLLMNQWKVHKELLLKDGRLLGWVLENFVFLELKKLATWAASPIALYHYRTQRGAEVDIVLENRAGQVVGIEVKATETMTSEDWKGLDCLKEELGDTMVRGLILYPGEEIVPFHKDRIAIPLSTLWNCV